MFIRYTLPFVIVVAVSLAIPSKRLEKKKEKHRIDEAGDKALKLLLSGATFYKDADGLRVYVKPGNEFEAAMEWYLMDLRNIIHYSNGRTSAQVGTRYVSFYPEQPLDLPASIIISGRNSIGQRKVFYYNSA